MEEKENKISAAMIVEAMEQVRMAFTASRIGFGAATLLQPLCKKDEKWCKKFMKLQNDYHTFLLSCYQDFEVEAARAEEAEKNNEEKTQE